MTLINALFLSQILTCVRLWRFELKKLAIKIISDIRMRMHCCSVHVHIKSIQMCMCTQMHTHQIMELKYYYFSSESAFHKHLAKPCGQSFIGSRIWLPICIVLHVFSALSKLKRIKHNILLICFSLQNEKSKPGFNNTYWLKKGSIAY